MCQGVVNIPVNQDLIVEINPQKNIRKDQIQEEDTLVKHQELKHQDHIAGQEKKILHTEDQEIEKGNQEITVVILQILQHQYANQDHL